jgi:hypothetical protein
MIRSAEVGILYTFGGMGLKSLREHNVPNSCKSRHLWDTLYECLMNPSSRCDKAMVVGATCYCRHPNRCNYFEATDEEGTNVSYTDRRTTG